MLSHFLRSVFRIGPGYVFFFNWSRSAFVQKRALSYYLFQLELEHLQKTSGSYYLFQLKEQLLSSYNIPRRLCEQCPMSLTVFNTPSLSSPSTAASFFYTFEISAIIFSVLSAPKVPPLWSPHTSTPRSSRFQSWSASLTVRWAKYLSVELLIILPHSP